MSKNAKRDHRHFIECDSQQNCCAGQVSAEPIYAKTNGRMCKTRDHAELTASFSTPCFSLFIGLASPIMPIQPKCSTKDTKTDFHILSRLNFSRRNFSIPCFTNSRRLFISRALRNMKWQKAKKILAFTPLTVTAQYR